MAAIGSDVYFAGIRELNKRLVAREFSAAELTRAFSGRLERIGPGLNALALTLSREAIHKAGEIDSDIKRGLLRGPLQGIPYAVKDLLSVAGFPTTWGARPYAAQVFDYTATAIEKLGASSALLIGKLSMVELAGGGGYRYAAASLTGPGLNPWDRSRWAGGSSSGPAAAVAAGLAPFTIGSETSGSILTPASYCGVTALRPTYGLVSRYGAMALSWTLDKLGPFAHNAEDCGLILQAMAGADRKDPGSAGKSFYYTPQYARPLQDLKIGYAPADIEKRADAAARPAFQAAMEALQSSGARMVEVRLPDFPYGQMLSTILSSEMGSIFEPLITSGQVEDLADRAQIAGLKASLEAPAKDYLRAMRLRRLMQRDIAGLLGRVDVLVAPGRTGPATPIDEPLTPLPGAAPRQAASAPSEPGFAALVQAGNLAGLPALNVPCGFVQGLPLGMQLVGAPFSENLLLALGNDFQSRTDWHKRRPPE